MITFLKGPIPWPWLTSAMALPGRALAVGIHVWLWAGVLQRFERIPLSLSRMPFPRSSGVRGLAALEAAGLLRVERRRGRRPLVTIVTTSGEHRHRRLCSGTRVP